MAAYPEPAEFALFAGPASVVSPAAMDPTDIPSDEGRAQPHLRSFSRSLPMRLLIAREAVMARFRPLMRSHGVTEQQWRILRAIAERGELDMQGLAQETFLLLPSLSRTVPLLERQGYLERRAAKQDQRRTIVRLTARGRRLLAAVGPHSEQQYAEIARFIGPDALEQLYDLLDRLAKLPRPAGSDADTNDDDPA